ncbi:Uncharacterized protein BP5553_02348 [Venustampulla echinocandica]|uniref:Aminoglycoside phosphotransferase domain-containing protein n=1 Tax=Venustampulla echinocandica TaxID=2656787 RepID=A0A370U3M0_9HELO|nr:Uncharacterized protein BP5553_02348 [Venustampulla echinocandica]RDL42369.1 Uncharacterized protein BP5553_02348 [Venustampulla echinocandica]
MHPTFGSAVEGITLSAYFGNRVVQSTTSGGHLVAVKVKPRTFARSEAKMMGYASQQAGLKAPRVLGCYDVEGGVTTMVSDLVPGVSLDQVWHKMNAQQQESIKTQLKEQIRIFRTCTKPYIGRIDHELTRNFYDRLGISYMGPFDSEVEFDEWCLARLKTPISRMKWKYLVPYMRGSDSKRFVLTHGDLAAHNIMVNDGIITGIVDWEHSGFFPEYVEYAAATVICDFHEEWWKPVLKEILEPCGSQRLKFQGLVKDRGW